VNFLGGREAAGKKLKAKSGWNKCNYTEQTAEKIDDRGRILAPAMVIKHDNCTDEYGFSALPGGHINDYNSDVDEGNAYWWTSTSEREGMAACRYMGHNYSQVVSVLHYNRLLFSVRCVHGSTEEEIAVPRSKVKISSRDIDMGSGDGFRSKAEIMSVVNDRMLELRSIYYKYLKLKPGFSGHVTLKFTIVPDGDIVSINIVSSSTGYAEFDNAVKNMVATWKWKVIKEGDTTPTIFVSFME